MDKLAQIYEEAFDVEFKKQMQSKLDELFQGKKTVEEVKEFLIEKLSYRYSIEDEARKKAGEAGRKAEESYFTDSPLTIEKLMAVDYRRIRGDVSYKAMKDFTKENFHEKGTLDYVFNGFNPTAEYQKMVVLAFDQTRPLEDQLEVLKFTPYIKEDSESNVKVISINGVSKDMFLLISDGIYVLSKSKFLEEDHKTIHSCNDLMEMIRYIYDNHPYFYYSKQKKVSIHDERDEDDNEWY